MSEQEIYIEAMNRPDPADFSMRPAPATKSFVNASKR